MRLFDLSHVIESGMPLFSQEAPQPEVRAWMSHEEAGKSGNYKDCTCELTEIRCITSMGTYMDSPYHFHPEAESIEKLRLEQLILPGIKIDCTHVQANEGIAPEVLDGLDVKGKAVLFHTGWSRYWGDPEYYRHPFITGDTAKVLVEKGAKLAGVDFLVIDNTKDPYRPVHVHLLKHKVLIVENLCQLDTLPQDDFIFHAAPIKFAGTAAFPVRAYATA